MKQQMGEGRVSIISMEDFYYPARGTVRARGKSFSNIDKLPMVDSVKEVNGEESLLSSTEFLKLQASVSVTPADASAEASPEVQ